MNQYQQDNEWKKYYLLKGKYERAAQNYSIQGEAGSITKQAGIFMREWILDNKLENNVFITNIIHDELSMEVKEEYSEITREALEKAMEKAGNMWCKTIKLGAEGVIADYWTH